MDVEHLLKNYVAAYERTVTDHGWYPDLFDSILSGANVEDTEENRILLLKDVLSHILSVEIFEPELIYDENDDVDTSPDHSLAQVRALSAHFAIKEPDINKADFADPDESFYDQSSGWVEDLVDALIAGRRAEVLSPELLQTASEILQEHNQDS